MALTAKCTSVAVDLPHRAPSSLMAENVEKYSVLIDLTAGTVGGIAGVVVGQPFDTVKVRLQTYSKYYNGALDCTRQTFRHEGFSGFFKGMTSPVVGSAATNAVMFAVYERTLKMIDDNPQNPTLKSVFYAGAVGGFWQTVPLAPAELIKCRLQVQDGRRSSQYRGPMDCIRHILKVRGTPGLFLGFTCTLWREVPSFAVYFWLYEYTKRMMVDGGINSTTSMLTAGGVAGVASWVVSYPFDVIKSAIQTLPVNHKAGEHKIAYQARQLYRLGGWRIFFSGLGTACVRAFPCNAVTFYGYEKSSELLKNMIRD